MVSDVLQPCRDQYECRAAVGECAHDPRPPPDLAVYPPDPVVGPDASPMLRRELSVGQGLLEPVADGSGCRRELHLVELGSDRLPLRHRDPPQRVSVEVNGAAPVAGLREHLLEGAEHARAPIARDEADARKATLLEPGEELTPRVAGLGVAPRAVDCLAVARRVDVDGDEDGNVPVRSAPATLEVDAVGEGVGEPALERPLTPLLDGREGLPVQVGDGARGHRRFSRQLGDVLDAPGGDARGVRLDDDLLDLDPAPAVPLDNGGLEGGAPELAHARLDLAGPGEELPVAAPAAVDLPSDGPPAAPDPSELRGLLIEQRVQALLDGPPDQIPDVVAQRLLVG